MNKNIKVAKQLIKLAKLLVADETDELIKALDNYKHWIKNRPQSYDLSDYYQDLDMIKKSFNKMKQKNESFFDGDEDDFFEYIKSFKTEQELDKYIKELKK